MGYQATGSLEMLPLFHQTVMLTLFIYWHFNYVMMNQFSSLRGTSRHIYLCNSASSFNARDWIVHCNVSWPSKARYLVVNLVKRYKCQSPGYLSEFPRYLDFVVWDPVCIVWFVSARSIDTVHVASSNACYAACAPPGFGDCYGLWVTQGSFLDSALPAITHVCVLVVLALWVLA